MANTLGTPTVDRGRYMVHGAFSDMWKVSVTITDQDQITATDSIGFNTTVPGVALGDVVIAYSCSKSLFDGADLAIMQCQVSNTNTLSIRFFADAAAFGADQLNDAVVRVLIGRPVW